MCFNKINMELEDKTLSLVICQCLQANRVMGIHSRRLLPQATHRTISLIMFQPLFCISSRLTIATVKCMVQKVLHLDSCHQAINRCILILSQGESLDLEALVSIIYSLTTTLKCTQYQLFNRINLIKIYRFNCLK